MAASRLLFPKLYRDGMCRRGFLPIDDWLCNLVFVNRETTLGQNCTHRHRVGNRRSLLPSCIQLTWTRRIGRQDWAAGCGRGRGDLGAVCTQKERAPQLCGAVRIPNRQVKPDQALRRRMPNTPSNPTTTRPIVDGSGTTLKLASTLMSDAPEALSVTS